MNIKLMLFWLIFSVLNNSFANELSSEHCFKNQLVAEYNIKQPTTNQVTLIRANKQIGVVYAEQQLAELWHQLPTNQVALTRYFTQYQRGIEYQPADLTQGVNWQALSSLISPNQIAGIKKRSSQGVGCQRTEHYAIKTNKQVIELIWLPELELVKRYQVKTNNTHGKPKVIASWQLKQLSFSNSKQIISQWQQWPTVDYADIGDNENAPFLAKMINQGFIKHHGQQFSFHQH